MDEREKLARIRLIQTRHIGPMTFSLLIQRYGSALAALAAIPDLAARGVVVIEAAAKSGSLITAREAGERGSEVMAIPGSPLDPRSNGCNQLIRDGATLVQNAADIIEAVGQNRTVEVPPKKTIWVEMPQTTFSDEDILKCREIIISGLGDEPVDVDDLIAWCDQPSAVVWAAILELELAGQLTRQYGNRVSRQFEF